MCTTVLFHRRTVRHRDLGLCLPCHPMQCHSEPLCAHLKLSRRQEQARFICFLTLWEGEEASRRGGADR